MSLKVSILVDCTNTYSGGARTHLREVFSRIPADDADAVYTFVAAEEILRILPDESDNVIKISAPLLNRGAIGRYVWRIFCLPRLVRKYDLAFFPGGTVAGKPRRSVTMSRNMLPLMREEYSRYGFSMYYFKIELLRILQRRSFHRAHGIIFLSEFAREMVAKETGFPADALSGFGAMIPHGITEEFRQVKRPKANTEFSKRDEISLLYVSSFDVYKNQETVMSAVKCLRDRGWKMTVRFVGPRNPYAFDRFSRSRDELDPNGDWTFVNTEVNQQVLRDYYTKADLFVYASTCENLPNILLEAMAAKIPIICSDSRPMSDILGNGGKYFAPRNVSSLTSVIEATLMSDEDINEMAQTAFEIAAGYDWDICAKDTLAYLRRINGMVKN